MEESHETRTHLLLNENSQLAAYFSLSFKEVLIPAEFAAKSGTENKKLGSAGSNPRRIRAILLAQLGKDEVNGIDLNFSELKNRFLDTAKQAQNEVGGRVLLAECEKKTCGECGDSPDCVNCDKLLKLYTSHDFRYIKTVTADSTGKQMHQIYFPLWIKNPD